MILSLQSAKNNKQQQQTNTYKYSQSVNTGLKIKQMLVVFGLFLIQFTNLIP